MADRSRRRDRLGIAVVAALVAIAIAFGAQRGKRLERREPRESEKAVLSGAVARYTLEFATGRLELATVDGASRLDVDLTLLVDGVERPIVIDRGDVAYGDEATVTAAFRVDVGESPVVDERAAAVLELRMEPASDLLTASLSVTPETDGPPHSYALRLAFAGGERELFVPGVGAVGDLGIDDARALVVGDAVHPFALASAQGPIRVVPSPPDLQGVDVRSRHVVTTRTETAVRREAGLAPKVARLDLSVVVAGLEQAVWGRVFKLLRVETGRVTGVVMGTRERAHVIAFDEEGRPQLRTVTDEGGRFAVDAPTSAVQWYAALEAAHTSAPVHFVPGSPWDLRLDVSPGGELRVRILDDDTKRPITARLFVQGIEGTLDPNFGPDYRASGAGPLVDVADGDLVTPLPAGHYRVSATKGLEWSIDVDRVEVKSGRTHSIELALRHVVPTPGLVGCDLHVHARPSFDSPVTPEDRVLSLVSAGVDFAVPSEHNLVGDYGPAIELLGFGGEIAYVPGVEVTTVSPRFGHFGVFPYSTKQRPPRYRGTSAAALLSSVRRADPRRLVQVNHPRLQAGIGYFQIVGFDPDGSHVPKGMRTDFDLIEVYNGYDLGDRARVERVMTDWYALLNLGKHIPATGSSDSHRIQYQWAGYPRTYAFLGPSAAGDGGGPVEPDAVVSALRRGRSFVTSGPIVELVLSKGDAVAEPGGELLHSATDRGALRARLTVRAAPWVDVARIDVVAGVPGREPGVAIVRTVAVASRPSAFGKEPGTLADAAQRTIRYQDEQVLDLPEGAKWVIVVVRGERRLDDALAFMPVQPLAFTNPVWLRP